MPMPASRAKEAIGASCRNQRSTSTAWRNGVRARRPRRVPRSRRQACISRARACLLIVGWWRVSDAVVDDERRQEYATEVRGCVLVVTGGDGTPLLEPTEAAFDRVAFPVQVLVERRGPSSFRALGLAVLLLVAAFGNGVRNLAFAQVLSGARMRVRLVGQQPERLGVVGAVRLEQRRQVGVVSGLPRREQKRQRAAERVGQGVDLGAQPAAGPAECVVGGFVGQILVIRLCPLCGPRCARRRNADGRARSWSRSTTDARAARRVRGPP